MPTYDYKCSNCQVQFEDLLKISERETPTKNPCPSCGNSNCVELELIHAPSLVSPLSLGLRKPTSDFKERLSQIKENHKNVKNLDGKFKDY